MVRTIRRQGSVLLASVIFLVVFSALAVCMATFSGASVQIADNQHHASCAFASAESGLEVARYWLDRVIMPSSTAPPDYFEAIISDLQSDLATNYVSNVTVSNSGVISPVTLNSATGQSFTAQLLSSSSDPAVLTLSVTGSSGEITRTIRVDFNIEAYEHPIFNYGLATKGPVNFPNNPTLTGATANWEADIYVESSNSTTAVFVGGNTNFDGNISIGNPLANVDFRGDVLIGGDHGQTAIDNHVFIGVDPVNFPVPDTARFRQYATGDTVDAATDISKGMVLTNATIAAGTDPTFAGSVTVDGILFIEAPNIVTFGRNLALRGVMVAEGDIQNPGTNSLTFMGNFDTDPYPPGIESDPIRHEIGSSIIAPGFSASFQGNFSALEGVMAVSGVHFSGNANAVIKGTILSYSESPAVVEGNVSMNFDRASSTQVPGGFDTHRVLTYDPSSYTVVF